MATVTAAEESGRQLATQAEALAAAVTTALAAIDTTTEAGQNTCQIGEQLDEVNQFLHVQLIDCTLSACV